MFAIARIEKIKSLKQAQVASAHNARTEPRFAKEVDEGRSWLNEILVSANGDGIPYADIRDRLPENRRKNAVLAVEVLLTASPEYFAEPGMLPRPGYYDDNKLQAWKSSALSFAKRHFGENLVNVALHLDEATPHLQMFVVPLRDDGKLDARSMFNRENLIKLQDEYHKSVEHLGLKRGVSASVSHREHESLSDYYKRSKEPVEEPELTKRYNYKPIELLEAGLFGKVDADEANKRIAEGNIRLEKHAEAHSAVSAEARDLAKTLKAKQDEADKAKRDYEKVGREAERSKIALEEAKKKNQELTAQLREIPIVDVLERLGAVQDKQDKSKWHTSVGTVNTSKGDQRFNSFDTDNLKGRGAIDLVCKVLEVDFKGATAWLAGEFGTGQAVATYAVAAQKTAENIIRNTPKPEPKIPEPNNERWDMVKEWLMTARKLPEKLLEAVHDLGIVFADGFGNAVFKSRNGKGAEIVGMGDFKGKRGQKEHMFTAGSAGVIGVTESAIDALSLLSTGQVDGVISTGGTPSDRQFERLREVAKTNTVLIAFDNDAKGDEFAEKAKAYGFDKRIKPVHKDWNDDLKAGVQADIATQLNPPTEPPRPRKSMGMSLG